jgi:acetyl-CoA acetyltransferase
MSTWLSQVSGVVSDVLSTELPPAGLTPRIMGIGPSIAIPKVLAKVGITMEDVDLFEVQYG